MNEKVKTALAENPEIQAYLRWGVLIFGIAVSWATLKGDVKQISHDAEGNASSAKEFRANVETFMAGATARNENIAVWQERLSRNEQEVREMRRDIYFLRNRAGGNSGSISGGYYQPPPPEPEWRSDPRRNP